MGFEDPYLKRLTRMSQFNRQWQPSKLSKKKEDASSLTNHLLQAIPIINEWLAGRSNGLKRGRPFLNPEEKLSDETDAVVQMLPMPHCSSDLPQNFLLLFRLSM